MNTSKSSSRQRPTLWVEQGFSRQEITARMQDAVPSLTLYSTPEQPLADTKSIAYPPLNNPSGIETLNELIERYKIDAIWPQKSARFNLEGLACEVHAAATPSNIALVNDKSKFYESLGDDKYRANATEVIGVEEVAKEYGIRRQKGIETCIKPVIGVNGHGYWKLTEKSTTSFLNDPERREIHPEVYFSALAQVEKDNKPQRMLLMDWLPGPEVSVDLLCWQGTPLIHAARTKLGESHQRIQSEHPVLEHAHLIASRLVMHGIVSMQYRLDHEGGWKILEVNARPAGGSINSEDAGFGIITDWARLVAHEDGPEDIVQRQNDVMLVITRVATKTALTSVD